jgi:hypothetical protein
MSKGLVEITISVEMELDDKGCLNGEQEKQLDDICCDIVDLVAKNDFEVVNDEWDIID